MEKWKLELIAFGEKRYILKKGRSVLNRRFWESYLNPLLIHLSIKKWVEENSGKLLEIKFWSNCVFVQ